jgi:hypothetical protein
MQRSGLGWLQDTSYSRIGHSLICAFVERWHEETSSFHLSFGEMTVTLDDVSCLLQLLIDNMLQSHETITRDDAVDSMVTHLGSDSGDALLEMTRTRGAHCRFSYLRRIFKDVAAVSVGEGAWCDSGGAEVARPSCPHIFAILGGDHVIH